MATVASKMTALANEVREISGATNKLSIDAMTSNLGEANDKIDAQATTIAEIAALLEGKSVPGGGSGGSVETCTVNVSGIGANWMYTTIDDAGNFSGKTVYTSSGALPVACNTMITAGHKGATFHGGYFTCTNAEMIYKDELYYASFLITASAGEIATISYTSTGCCFVAGTQVLTSLTGDTTAIELVHAGDNVVSYNINTGKNYLTEVKRVVINENTTDIAEIMFDNGTILKMNAYHPLYCKGGFKSITQYNGYDELVVGDIVKTVDGWTEIMSINRYFSDPIITYNLDVHDIGEEPDININDNYYANGIVAKNPVC